MSYYLVDLHEEDALVIPARSNAADVTDLLSEPYSLLSPAAARLLLKRVGVYVAPKADIQKDERYHQVARLPYD